MKIITCTCCLSFLVLALSNEFSLIIALLPLIIYVNYYNLKFKNYCNIAYAVITLICLFPCIGELLIKVIIIIGNAIINHTKGRISYCQPSNKDEEEKTNYTGEKQNTKILTVVIIMTKQKKHRISTNHILIKQFYG